MSTDWERRRALIKLDFGPFVVFMCGLMVGGIIMAGVLRALGLS